MEPFRSQNRRLSAVWDLVFRLMAPGILFLGGCTGAPKGLPPPSAVEYAPLLGYALQLQGTPYRWGKESPEEGFDCSGFVKHVYARYGVPLPRRTQEMAARLPPVARRERRAGDLVFFDIDGKPLSHVGIYLGGESFVHAPSSRTGRVMVSGLRERYWWERFVAVRRPSSGDRRAVVR